LILGSSITIVLSSVIFSTVSSVVLAICITLLTLGTSALGGGDIAVMLPVFSFRVE
jgi:hypothetical protein